MSARAILECDDVCPHDPEFVHRFFFGCVPKDFSERTGRSKTHSQTSHWVEQTAEWNHKVLRFVTPDAKPSDQRTVGRTIIVDHWFWDGGCDARIVARSASVDTQP